MRKLMCCATALLAIFLTGCLVDTAAQKEAAKRTADGKEKSASTSSQSQEKTQAAEILLTITPPEAPEKPQPPLPPVTPAQPVKVSYPGGQAEVPAGSKVTLKAGSSSGESQQQANTISTEQVWKAVRSVPRGILYAGIGLIVVGFIVAALVRGLRLTGLAISLGGIVGMGSVIILSQFGDTIAYCVGGAILFLAVSGGLVMWYVMRQKMLFQTAFSQTVAGVQKFMESSSPDIVADVKASLGRKQDSAIQALVKKEKV